MFANELPERVITVMTWKGVKGNIYPLDLPYWLTLRWNLDAITDLPEGDTLTNLVV